MGVIQAFRSRYQRRPTPEDVERILEVNAHRGFPGMLGSLDCMHWEWKNCPKAWKGAYTGKDGTPSLVLEVVATHDLWIWHSFFGLPGSLNNINVLDRSNLFQDLSLGVAPPCQYTVNGNLYTTPYYLADGIYPEWATLVKTFSSPQDPKKMMFSKVQEATRKDVERAFGVLQARFAIIKGPSRYWQPAHLELIMNCCIILHNMIVEDQAEEPQGANDVHIFDPPPPPPARLPRTFVCFMAGRTAFRNPQAHRTLRDDLVEHVWTKFGADEDDV